MSKLPEIYSRFGFNESQMAALRDIWQNKNPGAGVTNPLITREGRNAFSMGKGYLPPGTMDRGLGIPAKNDPGIEQSRQNILKFLDSYKSKPTVTPTAPIQKPQAQPRPQAPASRPQVQSRPPASTPRPQVAVKPVAPNTKPTTASTSPQVKPIDPQVIQQVNYDAKVGGRNIDNNPFQRAQNFLKDRLGLNPPDPSIKPTPTQQARTDAKAGGDALRAYNKTRTKPTSTGSGAKPVTSKVSPTRVNGIAPGVRTAAPVVFGALDAGNQIRQGENPLMATARAAVRGLGGGLGTAGALFVGGEGTPMDIYTGGLAYTAGANEADKYFNKGIEFLGLRSEIGRDKRTINGKLYDMGIPEHKFAYDAALKKAQTPNPSEVPIKGFDTLTPTQIKEAKTLANSDGERSNGNGVVQKGRNLSAINSAYADLFEGMTYNGDKFTPSIYNPFESNHLNTGESRQDLLDMGVDPDVVDNSMAGGSSEWDSDTDTYRQIAPISLQTTEGSPNIVRSGTQKIVEGVNGTIFGAEDEVPETIKRSRTSKLREKYLLGDLRDKNGNDMSTVQRLRLMRLEQGVVGGFGNRQLGGSPDISTPNMSTPIEEDQYRQYVAGDEGAADLAKELMEKYKAGLKNNG